MFFFFFSTNNVPRKSSFSDLSILDQTCTSLGINSILDLSYEFGEAQSTLFTEEQWSTLKSRFAVEEDQDADMDDNLIAIIDSFLRTVESMLTAKTSFSIKMNKLSSWVEHAKNSRMLNSEERFILFITQHLLKLYQKTSYLFNVEIDCSEWDFVLKSRLTRYMVKVNKLRDLMYFNINLVEKMEELFNNDALRTKWGDTVFKIGNEDGSTDLKIDLRVLLDTTVQRHNVENDVSSGEFAKYDPGRLKHQSDRCKLMIEGKIIINNMISRDIDICSIPILQICGTELIILVNSLVAPGLYVGNELHSFSLLNTFENFKLVPDLVKSLLKFRNKCMEAGCFVGDRVKTAQRQKGSTKGPKYQQKTEQPVPVKKLWTRRN
ncbi:hypothetical protein HPULCUR_003798 [Helicostylum pulchrum]|uniref:Uncharacterized protein n=1 Tax=Helicostylum pulchrum TaxID=562976 RepID=A0ABP9XUD7_9FUNG